MFGCVCTQLTISHVVSESDATSPLASVIPKVTAKVKLQISYNSSDQLLSVMVRHVRNLVSELAAF